MTILLIPASPLSFWDRTDAPGFRSYIHCKPIPVMKTGNSLCNFPNREKPVSITWEPCNKNRFFPVWEKYTGKSLFWPCILALYGIAVYC